MVALVDDDRPLRLASQRQRYATGLLNTLCAAARDAGAKHAVLNATWEGKQLYLSRGFTQIGESITWWRHLGKE